MSPGLAENVTAIMDIIYLKAPAPTVETPAAGDAQVNSRSNANKTARQGGGGARKRRGGFTVDTAAAPKECFGAKTHSTSGHRNV